MPLLQMVDFDPVAATNGPGSPDTFSDRRRTSSIYQQAGVTPLRALEQRTESMLPKKASGTWRRTATDEGEVVLESPEVGRWVLSKVMHMTMRASSTARPTFEEDGLVLFAQRESDGARAGCKLMRQQEGLRERDLLMKCGGQGVLAVHGLLHHPQVNAFFLLTELQPGGDLHTRLSSSAGVGLPEDLARVLIKDIVTGLTRCHRVRVAHHDIRPENILLQSNSGPAVLADFGVARQYPPGKGSDVVCGSPLHMPPDMLRILHGDSQTFDPFGGDMWSLGITLFQMLSGLDPAWSKSVPQELLDGYSPPTRSLERLLFIMQKGPGKLSLCSSHARQLVRSLLSWDAKSRPFASEAVLHPWLRNRRDAVVEHSVDTRESPIRQGRRRSHTLPTTESQRGGVVAEETHHAPTLVAVVGAALVAAVLTALLEFAGDTDSGFAVVSSTDRDLIFTAAVAQERTASVPDSSPRALDASVVEPDPELNEAEPNGRTHDGVSVTHDGVTHEDPDSSFDVTPDSAPRGQVPLHTPKVGATTESPFVSRTPERRPAAPPPLKSPGSSRRGGTPDPRRRFPPPPTP
eukprot:Hpha_TRINITY_DN23014_c0_g1::TRINITY_DN23014_c0_g1_i1::g.109298::m.109298